MNFSQENLKKISKWVISTVSICILIYLGIKNYVVVFSGISWIIDIVMPLILGFVFAVILNVPMSFFERHLFTKTKKRFLIKCRRPLAFILSLILILGILVGVICLVIPELINAFKIIGENIKVLIQDFSARGYKIGNFSLSELLAYVDIDKISTTLQEFLKNYSSNIVGTAVNTISKLVGGVVNGFLAIIFAVYILFGKETFKRQCSRLMNAWLSKKQVGWIVRISSLASKTFRNYISGQTLEACILGGLCFIGMLILRIPYAPMISALIGVMAFIPVVGAFVGVFVGAFMIITVSPIKTVIFVIFFIALQQIEGNLIYPKVMGSKINLPAIWILAGVTIGGALFGAVGMIVFVPLTSIVYVLVREETEKREKKLKIKSKKEE